MSRTFAALRRSARPFLVAVTALSALSASALAFADGIDISHWQGKVTWSKVKSDGVTFAFMKATEGSYYSDPTLATNWSGAESQGIYRSAYHFARPSVGSAAAQARYFVSKAGTFNDRGDLPPVLDLEATGGLGPSALRTWVSTWLSTVEGLTGRTPILYFSPYFWIDHMGNSTAFTRYPLWIAHYTTNGPLVPGGWSRWTFWQRTSSGSVSGIAGNVDMNRFNGTSSQLAALANSTGGGSTTPPAGPTLPAGKPTALTMTPGTSTPDVNQSVTFAGDLRTTTPVADVANRAVSVWRRPVGWVGWRLVKSGVTDGNGHYSLSAAVTRSADYQARFLADPTYAASVSPLVRLTTPARVATAVDLRPNKTSVLKGAPLMLYGHLTSASAGLAGEEIRYYKRALSGGSWIYVGRSSSLAPTGWHSLTVHPKIARVWKAVFAGSGTRLPTTSSYLTVRPR